MLLAVSAALCPAAAPVKADATRLQELEELQAQLQPILLPEPEHYFLSYQLVHLRWVEDLAAHDFTADDGLVVDYLVWRLCKGDPPSWEALLDLDEGDADIVGILRRDYDDRSALHILPLPDAEKRQQLAAIDTTERAAALKTSVRSGLSRALEDHGADFRRLVREDVAAALARCRKAYDDDDETLEAMRDAGWHAVPTAEDVEAAYQKLKALRAKTPSVNDDRALDMDPPYFALGPGAAPMSFARDQAMSYLEARDELEKAIVGAVKLAMEKEDRDVVLRGLDGTFELRRAIRDQARRLRWGRPAAILDLLAEIAERYGEYCQGHSGGEGVTLGSNGDVVTPAKQCANWLRQYGERWCADPETPPLYAMVETDGSGDRIWKQGGWLRWRWLDRDEVEDLKSEGRVLELEGRTWVVPPETATEGVAKVQQLRDKGCAVAELVVALDLNQLE